MNSQLGNMKLNIPTLDTHLKLKALREARKLSIRALVELVKEVDPTGEGRSHTTLNRYELPPTDPKHLQAPPEMILIFAQIYNVKPSWLVFPEEAEHPKDEELYELLQQLPESDKNNLIALIRSIINRDRPTPVKERS